MTTQTISSSLLCAILLQVNTFTRAGHQQEDNDKYIYISRQRYDLNSIYIRTHTHTQYNEESRREEDCFTQRAAAKRIRMKNFLPHQPLIVRQAKCVQRKRLFIKLELRARRRGGRCCFSACQLITARTLTSNKQPVTLLSSARTHTQLDLKAQMHCNSSLLSIRVQSALQLNDHKKKEEERTPPLSALVEKQVNCKDTVTKEAE